MAVCDGPLLRAAGPPIGDPRRSGARPEPGLRHVAGRALYGGRSLAAGPDRVATAPAEAGSGRSCRSLVRDASPTSQQPAQRSALHPRGQVRARGDPAIALWKLDLSLTQLLGQRPAPALLRPVHRVRLGCIMRPPGQWDRPARRQTSDDIVCTTTARERHAAAAPPGRCNSGTRHRERTTLVPRSSTGWGACRRFRGSDAGGSRRGRALGRPFPLDRR